MTQVLSPMPEGEDSETGPDPSRDATPNPEFRSRLKRKLSPGSHAPTPPPPKTQHFPLYSDPADVHPPPTFAPSPPLPFETPFDFHQTRDRPMNKQGFRYLPCGPMSALNNDPMRIPALRWLESEPRQVRWSWEDRSPFINVTKDGKTVMTERGWRAARANVAVRSGAWYWEYKVERGGGEEVHLANGKKGEASWVRVGIGRREANLNSPVGADPYSYGFRDKGGDRLSLARPKPYGRSFKSGDVIGVYLFLPPTPSPPLDDPTDPHHIVRKRMFLRFRGNLYLESLEYPQVKEMDDLMVGPVSASQAAEEAKKKKAAPPPGTKVEEDLTPPARPMEVMEGSYVAFFINGECQGVAFEDLYDYVPPRPPAAKYQTRRKGQDAHTQARVNNHDDGTLGYYPFVSVFGGGTVTLNTGPDFEYPPPANVDELVGRPQPATGPVKWRPLSERWDDALREQEHLDRVDHMKLAERWKVDKAEEERREKAEAEEREVAAAAAEEARKVQEAADRKAQEARGAVEEKKRKAAEKKQANAKKRKLQQEDLQAEALQQYAAKNSEASGSEGMTPSSDAPEPSMIKRAVAAAAQQQQQSPNHLQIDTAVDLLSNAGSTPLTGGTGSTEPLVWTQPAREPVPAPASVAPRQSLVQSALHNAAPPSYQPLPTMASLPPQAQQLYGQYPPPGMHYPPLPTGMHMPPQHHQQHMPMLPLSLPSPFGALYQPLPTSSVGIPRGLPPARDPAALLASIHRDDLDMFHGLSAGQQTTVLAEWFRQDQMGMPKPRLDYAFLTSLGVLR